MNTYIAYFDILGFKSIVLNNSLSEISKFVGQFFRETQWRLTDKYYQCGIELLPDLSTIDINCMHVSDSVVLWTNSDSEDDFNKIVNLCSTLYKRSISVQIPIRGCLTYGEIEAGDLFSYSSQSSKFVSSTIYGKGYVEAYLQGESLLLSACVLGDGLVQKSKDSILKLVDEGMVCSYRTPQKDGEKLRYLFRPKEGGYSELAFSNACNSLKGSFTIHSKEEFDKLPIEVLEKYNNTVKFLRNFKTN